MQKSNRTNGFTLIETIVYLFIISVLVTAVSSISFVLYNTQVDVDSRIEVLQEIRFVRQQLLHSVQGAKSITNPAIGLSDDSLTLVNSNTDTITFDVNDNILRMKINAGEAEALTTEKVFVSDLSFHTFNYADLTHKTVRAQASFTSTNVAQPASLSLDVFINTE